MNPMQLQMMCQEMGRAFAPWYAPTGYEPIALIVSLTILILTRKVWLYDR